MYHHSEHKHKFQTWCIFYKLPTYLWFSLYDFVQKKDPKEQKKQQMTFIMRNSKNRWDDIKKIGAGHFLGWQFFSLYRIMIFSRTTLRNAEKLYIKCCLYVCVLVCMCLIREKGRYERERKRDRSVFLSGYINLYSLKIN